MVEEYTAIRKIAENTLSNSRTLNNDSRQRRHGLYDDFGSEYNTVGDNNSNGRVWIAITPDIDKFVRWEFKLIVQSFIVPIAGSEVNPTSLEVGETNLSINNNAITPNPHRHEILPNPHSHTVTAGVSLTPSSFKNFRISIDGIDLTALFESQFPLPSENGVYPDETIAHRYDIIEACSHLSEIDRNQILSAGYHEIQCNADGIFNLKFVNFIKYSFINRDGNTTDTEDTMLKMRKYSSVRPPVLFEYKKTADELSAEIQEIENQFMSSTYVSNSEQAITELKLKSEHIKLNQQLSHLLKINRIKERLNHEL